MNQILHPTTEASLLDACDALMARYGFRKMTMDDVAKEAGVSRRTIYNFFANKEDLGLSSIGRVVGDVFCEMEEIALSNESATHKLKQILCYRVIGRLHRVNKYASSLDELFEAVRPAYLERRRQIFEQEENLVKKLLLEGEKSGEFTIGASQFSESMLLATNAFIPYSLSPDELGERDEITTKLNNMVTLLMDAVINHSDEKQS